MKAFSQIDYQYQSQRKIFSLPLISINLGFDKNNNMRHAKGIIAIGTKATGIFSLGIFQSVGVVAIGSYSFGLGTVSLFSIGLLTVSVMSLGVISISIFAFGYLAIGVLAVGYKSIGIFSIGYEVVGIIGIGETVNSLFDV